MRTTDQPHGIAESGVLRRPERPRRGAYGEAPAGIAPSPQAAGLVLMTAPLLIGDGTMLARSVRLLRGEGRGTIELSPADAQARGIVAGDAVEVRSRHGRVQAVAQVRSDMPAGRVFLAENAPGVHTNLLLAWSDPLPRVEVMKS